MGIAIAVMNAKGGVGKSTLVLALAETLANEHGRRVLVIDGDAQASVSHMLVHQPLLESVQDRRRTLVDYLIAAVLREQPVVWRDFAIAGVSDVDDARSIDLLPSDTHATLFEREVSKGDREVALRRTVGSLLADARARYDFVLVDCAPGLSVLTESFLREADYYLSPTRPDYISARGLAFLREFRQRDPHMAFAQCLGVVINMKDGQSPHDAEYERRLRAQGEHHCFRQALLRSTPLQTAARFASPQRSYWAKYPGQTGDSLRQLAAELLARVASLGAVAAR